MSGTLFVVATPIGNRDDLSPRARHTLENAGLVAAEDTRHTGRLLSYFGVKTPLIALHDHNEDQVVAVLIEEITAGKDVALVSDAGTPLISDPGYRLVAAAHAAGLRVVPVAGPSAVVAALSAAGLPTDRFCFEGFLPAKPRARAERLRALGAEPRSMVFYESVHRVRDSLVAMCEAFGNNRPAFIGRELTKLHEQCVQAPLAALLQKLDEGDIPCKGEFVLVVAGTTAGSASPWEEDVLLTELSAVMSAKDAARVAARITGTKRNEHYARILALKDRE